jgi:hypothetical protein
MSDLTVVATLLATVLAALIVRKPLRRECPWAEAGFALLLLGAVAVISVPAWLLLLNPMFGVIGWVMLVPPALVLLPLLVWLFAGKPAP